MTTNVLDNKSALALAVAQHVAAFVRANPGKLMCFAAGDTPLAAYAELSRMHKAGEIDLNTMWFVGLDEWVGLGYEHAGSCRQVMYDGFYDLAGIDHTRILAFDGLGADLAGQCRAIDQWIEDHGGIALTVLGIGMNGHVGFNEPGASADADAHTVDLDDTTLRVGVKYFPDGQVPGQGITVGLRQLLSAQHILLVASGSHKADVVTRALLGQIGQQMPASLLRRSPALSVWLDKAAAANL